MGGAPRGQRVRRQRGRRAGRARAPRSDRRALGVADGRPRVEEADPRRARPARDRLRLRAGRARASAATARPCSRWARGFRCFRSGRGRASHRSRSTSTDDRAAARGGGARHRPRARPVHAVGRLDGPAPLAFAERRDLPRADRAGALDAGGAAAGGDLLRAARRPQRHEPRDGGADGALLPGPLGAAGAGSRHRRGVVARRRSPAMAPCASPTARWRSAAGVRTFLRALRRLPTETDWEAAVLVPDRRELRIPAALRERGHAVARPATPTPEQLVAGADIVCATTGGAYAAPWLVRSALASGTVPVCSHVAIYEELTGDGDRGPAVRARRRDHSRRPARAAGREPPASSRARAHGRGSSRSWSDVGRRGRGDLRAALPPAGMTPDGDAGVAAAPRCAGGTIHVDLHMHTDHSPDCATPPLALLEAAKAAGLGAIAITDHNEVSGAFAAQRAGGGDRRDQGDRRRGGQDRRAG